MSAKPVVLVCGALLATQLWACKGVSGPHSRMDPMNPANIGSAIGNAGHGVMATVSLREDGEGSGLDDPNHVRFDDDEESLESSHLDFDTHKAIRDAMKKEHRSSNEAELELVSKQFHVYVGKIKEATRSRPRKNRPGIIHNIESSAKLMNKLDDLLEHRKLPSKLENEMHALFYGGKGKSRNNKRHKNLMDKDALPETFVEELIRFARKNRAEISQEYAELQNLKNHFPRTYGRK